MNKELIFTIIRTLLTVAGAFLIGRTFFGVEVNNEIFQGASGAILVTISTIWGISDKTITIEKIESAARQVLVFVGGILVARGVANVAQVEEIIGAVLVLITYLSSYLSKKKSTGLQEKTVVASQLKTLDE